MKTIKVSEATGAALDWLVAKCDGKKVMRCGAGPSQYLAYIPKQSAYKKYTPSTNWSQGGPIIERKRIDVAWSEDGWYANMYWRGVDVIPAGAAGESFRCGGDGPTPLIAAMRCYVVSKLGDTAEVPEELL